MGDSECVVTGYIALKVPPRKITGNLSNVFKQTRSYYKNKIKLSILKNLILDPKSYFFGGYPTDKVLGWLALYNVALR